MKNSSRSKAAERLRHLAPMLKRIRSEVPLSYARTGDVAPLVELLRSEKPIGRDVRDYLADELEREPEKRFRRREKTDLHLRESDNVLMVAVTSAKFELAIEQFGDPEDESTWQAARSHESEISDAAALSWLTEAGIFDGADTVELKNARRRFRQRYKV